MYRISGINSEQTPATTERKIVVEDYTASGFTKKMQSTRHI